MNLKLAIGILTIAVMAVPGIAVAQDNRDTSTQTATGCLQKGPTANIYMLTDENGKTWDLRSNTVIVNGRQSEKPNDLARPD